MIGEEDAKWVTSAGGPLLLVPMSLLHLWGGIEPPSDGRRVTAKSEWNPGAPPCDYDRACDVTDYIAPIEIGDGRELVLGDYPMQTTWIAAGDARGGTLVRWICADEGGHLLACAASAPAGSYSEPEIDYEVHDPELLLFHSAEPGSAIRGDSLLVRMQPGRYVVATAYYKADARTEMVLHQFRPSAAGIRGGVVVLGTGVSLPDGTEVTVISDPASPPAETLGQRLMKYAGVFKGPTDLARNHDHYIHGTLRK